MNRYTHYSFDLWLTLIRSHPSFKAERTKYFYCNFNAKNKSIAEVDAIFRQVDRMCNAINEKTGGNIDAGEMYLMVIHMIDDWSCSFMGIDIQKIYNDLEALVFSHLPVLYANETLPVLRSLKERGDCTLSILSNTGFIKGITLRKVLKMLGIDEFFDFQLYSDEAGMSKPNPGFFRLMTDAAISCKPGRMLNLQDIIHVGDNALADLDGAHAAGIAGLIVNTTPLTLHSLLSNDHVFTS